MDAAKREFFEELFSSTKIDETYDFEELFKIKKFADNDYEYMSVFRVISKGPFSPDPKEVEFSFFVELKATLKDISENPSKYTETTILLLREYQNRYL